MTTINDLVLIYFENQPLSFARVEEILPDHKKDWYHISLLLLQIPPQTVTWILKNNYINGDEFTMDGKRMRLERLAPAGETPPNPPESRKPSEPASGKSKTDAKVVSLSDRKPKA